MAGYTSRRWASRHSRKQRRHPAFSHAVQPHDASGSDVSRPNATTIGRIAPDGTLHLERRARWRRDVEKAWLAGDRVRHSTGYVSAAARSRARGMIGATDVIYYEEAGKWCQGCGGQWAEVDDWRRAAEEMLRWLSQPELSDQTSVMAVSH